MNLDSWVYVVLFFVGGIAGLVDAIAGGGGIITIPALLNFGFSVPLALGTNKLQATFGSTSAAVHYGRAGLIDVRTCVIGVIATLIGALIGAGAVQRLDPALLQTVVPWLLAAVVVYNILRPRTGNTITRHVCRFRRISFFLDYSLDSTMGFSDRGPVRFGPSVWSRCSASTSSKPLRRPRS